MHTMLSFGFAGEPVTISIETREERGEACSSLAGFFRQYDLIYVVGDEHDLFGVRTNHRRPEEQVYLYRTRSRHEKRPAPVPRPSGRNATARRPGFSQRIRHRLPRPSIRSARPRGLHGVDSWAESGWLLDQSRPYIYKLHGSRLTRV